MVRAGHPAWDEDEAFFDERPVRRARRRRRSWLRMILMSSLMIAGLVHFAQQKSDEAQVKVRNGVPSSVLIAPAPAWTPVAAIPALYSVEGAPGPLVIEARRHTSGAREDMLTMGRFGDPRYARLTLVQGSPEPAHSFFVDIARRAAQAGLAVARNSQSRAIATKFGPVEAASMTLVGTSEQECQAFRFSETASGFGFQGWMCGTEAVIDDAQLACFIDGITLGPAGSPSLKALFSRAERSRTEACGAASRTAAISVRPPPRP
ncbi:hypothetical protein [Microvirga makkahensis]|uniref:Uncharacterized protein n=1 Tax=Microvirga makkahensis TaxID=1128670 RepID=A0A7X3SQN1_9HYPH|nr:hypothetical protein [Microvirga makkahensis]MXQ13443.1 hypothetical protein [Microvirga makkahensis]